MKELSVEDQIYLCKYHDVDESLGTTIGVNRQQAKEIISKLKQNGLYEQYRKLSEDEYEEIIKKEKYKSKDNICSILEKYKFDKTKKGYASLKDVMRVCLKYNDSTELSLEKVFRDLADKQGIKSYIINNGCKRLLENAYVDNKEIFEANGYNKKPTLREFVLQELGIKKLENICENKETPVESKENVICDITPNGIGDIENTYVKVSVKTIMDWSYQKGYLDRMIEEAENEKNN